MRAGFFVLALLAVALVGCGEGPRESRSGVPCEDVPAREGFATLPPGFRYTDLSFEVEEDVRGRLPDDAQGGVLARRVVGNDEGPKIVMVVPNQRRSAVGNLLVREARREGKEVEPYVLEVGREGNDVPLVTYDPGPEERNALVVQADCNVVVIFGRDQDELAAAGAFFQKLEAE